MSTKELLDKAMKLNPKEKALLVESLIRSLDQPDSSLDEIWADESERRLKAYRAGNLEGIAMEEVFKSHP